MTEQSLAQQQAAGLRALADIIEANPDLAAPFRYTLTSAFYTPLVSADDKPRQTMELVAHASRAAGAAVTVTNDVGKCTLTVWFPGGGVVVAVTAEAALMAGEDPVPAPKYAPLNVEASPVAWGFDVPLAEQAAIDHTPGLEVRRTVDFHRAGEA